MQQLFEDLKYEVDENSKRLAEICEELEKDEDTNQNTVSVSMLMKGYSVGGISFRLLRTVAMEQILKPENPVHIRDLTLEENVEWLYRKCKQFNAVLSKALNELEAELESGKARKQTIAKPRSCVFSGTSFLLGMLHGLSSSLDSQAKR